MNYTLLYSNDVSLCKVFTACNMGITTKIDICIACRLLPLGAVFLQHTEIRHWWRTFCTFCTLLEVSLPWFSRKQISNPRLDLLEPIHISLMQLAIHTLCLAVCTLLPAWGPFLVDLTFRLLICRST